jgi:hypothetical protein
MVVAESVRDQPLQSKTLCSIIDSTLETDIGFEPEKSSINRNQWLEIHVSTVPNVTIR